MPAPGDQPTVSFVVIAHNEATNIERALHSILVQAVDKEVVVVDDGSCDHTPSVVSSLALEHPTIRLVELGRNRGRGFARQTGVRLARGRFIATVDGDVTLPPHWWERCAAELEHADAVSGTALPDGDVAYLCVRLALRPRFRPHTTIVSGSNAVFRRGLLEQVPFDPALRDGEDVALNHALLAEHARLRRIPGLLVAHHENKDFARTLIWLYQSGRGATRQLWRYREVRQPDLALAGLVIAGASGVALRGRGGAAVVAPGLLYLGAAAAAHVRRAFVCERRDAGRLGAAAVIDMTLLGAYFCGRIAGLRAIFERS
jgi:glycosyltransferase involved in cell wall biosynthesis